MERWNRRPVVVTLLASALATATIATTAWLGMQWILRQDVRDSAQARTVIAVFELRAEAERFMGRARAFLLSGDDAVLHRFDADRAAFRTSLDRIASRERSSAKELAPVRAAADEYSAVLDAAIPARRTAPNDEVSLSYETRLRSLRARLDAAFDDLIEREEAQLHSREGSTRQTAASIAALASAIALGALAVALALGLWLARAFQSLAQKRVELEEAKLRLEAANRDLEAFAGRAAHDLRGPLAPILLLATRLQLSSREAAVVSAAGRIGRCAERAGAMVESLLTFSRIGGMLTEPANTAAAKSISETLGDFADDIRRDGVALETHVDSAVRVACAPALFRVVVANLVSNALKFLNEVETRRLSVRLSGRGDAVELEVADSGPGIPADAVGRIFEPFYRVPGTTASGSGIGLATVRRIVDAYHGSVTVSSHPGGGATFRVVLPRAEAVPDATARSPHGMEPGMGHPPPLAPLAGAAPRGRSHPA